jgi:hypothetical protein
VRFPWLFGGVSIVCLRRALKRPTRGIIMNLEKYLMVIMLFILAGLISISAMS